MAFKLNHVATNGRMHRRHALGRIAGLGAIGAGLSRFWALEAAITVPWCGDNAEAKSSTLRAETHTIPKIGSRCIFILFASNRKSPEQKNKIFMMRKLTGGKLRRLYQLILWITRSN